MPEKLSDLEIDKAAWSELLDVAGGAWESWRDEFEEYGDDEVRIYARMGEILQELKERHL